MTNTELEAQNHAATLEQLNIGYGQTKYWLGVFEQELEDDKRRWLPHRPDLYRAFTGSTLNQIADLRRELAAYEREFDRRGLPLTARESSPQVA